MLSKSTALVGAGMQIYTSIQPKQLSRVQALTVVVVVDVVVVVVVVDVVVLAGSMHVQLNRKDTSWGTCQY